MPFSNDWMTVLLRVFKANSSARSDLFLDLFKNLINMISLNDVNDLMFNSLGVWGSIGIIQAKCVEIYLDLVLKFKRCCYKLQTKSSFHIAPTKFFSINATVFNH